LKSKILVVDDEPLITEALEELFCDDYIVFQANDGKDALEIIRNNPDLKVIISDQRMPYMSGREVLKESKNFVPEAFRLIISGYFDSLDLDFAIESGDINMILSKPWDIEELINIVETEVKKRS
jgi:response regulator RpfG family c-di-GMP phosphodiesterase